MPHKCIDLTGKRFGRLTCIRRVGRDAQRRSLWLCECECGNQRVILLSSLTGGKTKSCGCLAIEKSIDRVSKHFLSIDENGKTPRLYRIWRNMKSRCYNPNTPKYKNHGGRGIKVCDEWQEYLPFHNWAMNNGYSDGLTIERIDNDGDYEPSNCKWATCKEQNLNKRDNRLITYECKTKSLAEWAESLGIKYSTLRCRLDDYSWSIEKAFTTPVKGDRNGNKVNKHVS
jgi:hypothetical protein